MQFLMTVVGFNSCVSACIQTVFMNSFFGTICTIQGVQGKAVCVWGVTSWLVGPSISFHRCPPHLPVASSCPILLGGLQKVLQ